MEYILFGFIGTILLKISRNEMIFRFEVASDIEKQGLRRSLHKKGKDFPNKLIQL